MSERLKAGEFSAFIYDLDDTLADNRGPEGVNIHKISKMQAIRLAGEVFGLERLREVTYEQEARSFMSAPEHSIESGLRFLIAELYGNSFPAGKMEALVSFIAEEKFRLHADVMRAHIKPIRGAKQFVTQIGLAGMQDRQAIATGSPRRDAEIFLVKAGMHRHFPQNKVVTKEDVANPKPHPEGFLQASQRLKIGSSALDAVLVFEDDPKGIEAAKEAGMQVAGLATRFSADELSKYLPDPKLIFADFTEVGEAFGFRAS